MGGGTAAPGTLYHTRQRPPRQLTKLQPVMIYSRVNMSPKHKNLCTSDEVERGDVGHHTPQEKLHPDNSPPYTHTKQKNTNKKHTRPVYFSTYETRAKMLPPRCVLSLCRIPYDTARRNCRKLTGNFRPAGILSSTTKISLFLV